jgi:para-nitrobenzyl esterase
MSVAILMATPSARGLFCRAVVQSGSASATVTPATSATVAACVADAADLKAPDADAWRGLPLDRLIAAEHAVACKVLSRRERRLPELAMAGVPMAFQPTSGTEALPAPPLAAIRDGCAAGIDLLTGNCAEEVLSILKAWPRQLGVAPGQDVPEPTVLTLAGLITGGRGVTPQASVDAYREIHTGASSLDVAGAMLSDWGFRMPGLALAEAQADHADVFLYELSWRGSGVWGAGHALDLPLVFDTCGTETGRFLTGGTDPKELVAGVHGAWVSFAQDGRPSDTRLPKWPTFDTIRRRCLLLDDPFRAVEAHRAREHALWNQLH